AMALDRALSLFAGARGSEGMFPEFYFFDCHSCHRRISDDPRFRPGALANPARPIPAGMPPFNDENMIMLSAAARVAAPGMAARFDSDARAFHAALAQDRGAAVVAAGRLAETSLALAKAIDGAALSSGMAYAVVDQIASGVTTARFTDYAGSAQAVMALDTMLGALVKSGQVTIGAAAGIRVD